MANGKLRPIHNYTGDGFNVHFKDSGRLLEQHPWLAEKEADYHRSPEKHFGGTLWTDLEAMLSSIDLNYVGVDFAPATAPEEDGKLVVFEINPAMRNKTTTLPAGDRVQQAWTEV